MTRLYVTFYPPAAAVNALARHDWASTPNVGLLVSFFFIKEWEQVKLRFHSRPARLLLDSGAFSAWNSGQTIDIDALIAETKTGKWDETIALDVIGDSKGSTLNAAKMAAAGSPAFPVFHIGEPWSLLRDYCAEHAKVGLSCLFGEKKRDSLRFYDGCFARCYPHRFHSFGWVEERMLMRFPFHSADSSSWAMGPLNFGRWPAFRGHVGNLRFKIPQERVDLRSSIHNLGALADKVCGRWASEANRWPKN